MGWLRRNRVLLPGVSVLARQVSEVRTIAEKRLHATIAQAAARADRELPGQLVATLVRPDGTRFSELERLRRPPTRTTGTAFARALERVEEIVAFGLGRVRLNKIPPNRLAVLARYGLGSKAAGLERASEPKRTAMLTAVMRHLEAKAIDEALDLFQVLMATRLISAAKHEVDDKLMPPAWRKAVFANPELPTGAVDRRESRWPSAWRRPGRTRRSPSRSSRTGGQS
ncbi:hypothetical protein JCM4814A_02890 [Streptomyces phaeofaciens JCM 4814]|nr:hypothetical protein [Streptomyces phaeofaciens]